MNMRICRQHHDPDPTYPMTHGDWNHLSSEPRIVCVTNVRGDLYKVEGISTTPNIRFKARCGNDRF